MQRSGSNPQPPCTCEPVEATMRSLSDTHVGHGSINAGINGKYDVKKKIELYKGSVSTVYKCMLAGGSTVVIKMYHKGKMAEKHFHKLEREVTAMRLLCQEVGGRGVVQLMDTFEDASGIYLVMECCEGGDLFKKLMLHGGRLPEHWVCVEVIAPLLQVLDRMHQLHLMHRDIKPENIFITAQGEVKLGDFGLAIDWTKELAFSRSGTLDYMAPEVLLNPATHTQEGPSVTAAHLLGKNIRPYTTAVDVWAVGCLAYELVCGRPPFEVEDEKQTASLIIYSNNIHFEPSATPMWVDFVTQALIKDPRQRPDAATLLGHPWIRTNMERAAAMASATVSALVSSRTPPGSAVTPLSLRPDTARAIACPKTDSPVPVAPAGAGRKSGQSSVNLVGGAVVGSGSSSVAAAAAGAASESNIGGSKASIISSGISISSSSACGSGSVVSESSAVSSKTSMVSSSIGNSSNFAAGSGGSGNSTPAQNRSGSMSSGTAQAFRNAAAMLATRAGQQSSGSMAQTQAVGSSPASPAASGGALYGSPANTSTPQRTSSGAASSPYQRANTGSSSAIRSLLDAFKSASLSSCNTTTSGAVQVSGAERSRMPAARPPSAGSGSGSSASASMLRTSFQFQLQSDRDAPNSNGSNTAPKPQRPSLHAQVDRDAVSSVGGSSTAAVVASRTLVLSREPSRAAEGFARGGGSAGGNPSTPGMVTLQRPPQQSGTMCTAVSGGGSGFNSPSRLSRNTSSVSSGLTIGTSGAPVLSLASPTGKPPRPHPDGTQMGMSLAVPNSSSPLRRTLQPNSPKRGSSPTRLLPSSGPVVLQPSVSPQRGERTLSGQAQPPSASTLHDLARSWGAVVSVNIGKFPSIANGAGGRGSGSGSAFASPQRQTPIAGGKGLDAYGLPTATPVASGLTLNEYCSPRPAGVLERVKYHLRGGSSASTPLVQNLQQQQQAVHGPGPYSNSAVGSSSSFSAVDVK